MKKLLSIVISALIAVAITVPVFANDSTAANDYSLLYTENLTQSLSKSVNSPSNQNRLERHNRLIEQGYTLVSISSDVSNNDSPYSRAYDNYETRAVTSYYTQPIKKETKRGAILDLVSNVNNYILTPLSFVPKIGWIPGAVGITANLLSDFIARGEVTFSSVSTLRYYDIDVRQKGTSKYFFVASSQRFEEAVTLTTLGYTSNGTPYGQTKSKDFANQSPNYNNFKSLSEIAKEYYVTGGPNMLYVYFEQYTQPDIYYF